MPTTQEFYNTNSDFREFIDKESKNRNLPVSECLKHKMSQEVMLYYIQKDRDVIKDAE